MFVTSNAHKFAEAQKILRLYKIQLEHLLYAYEEIRADDIKQIAIESAKTLFRKIKKPLVVEDSGLFILSLNGFPGVYSAWVQKKLGNNGILKLLSGTKNRGAYFKSCIAYIDSKNQKVFCGEVHGIISKRKKGNNGFDYDPIFIPNNIQLNSKYLTFAESETLKNSISHRFNAFTELAKWYSVYIR